MVVEVKGIGDETDASLLYESRLDGGRADGKAQVVRADAARRITVGQRVPKDGAGKIGSDGCASMEVTRVKLLSQGGRLAGHRGDIGLERWRVITLLKLHCDLVPNGTEPRVDVVRVDSLGVGRMVPPE